MAKRTVDKRKTAKALRKLRRAAERTSGQDGPELTNWEKEFVEGVSDRLEKYGSAFRDPAKGRLEEALSQRQAHVARAIDKKSRGKVAAKADDASQPRSAPKSTAQWTAKSGRLRRSEFKRKTPMGGRTGPRVRDINADMEAPALAPAPDPVTTPEQKRAALRVVPGGKNAGKGSGKHG